MKTPHSATNAARGQEQIGVDTPILGHAIGIRNGILAPLHQQQIGSKLWTYLWLIDKQTAPSGLVLGGAPITNKRISDDLGLSERKVRRDLRLLADGERPYIRATRRFRGLTIWIERPKKRWERSAKSYPATGQSASPFRPELADPRDKTKTRTIDSDIVRRLEALG